MSYQLVNVYRHIILVHLNHLELNLLNDGRRDDIQVQPLHSLSLDNHVGNWANRVRCMLYRRLGPFFGQPDRRYKMYSAMHCTLTVANRMIRLCNTWMIKDQMQQQSRLACRRGVPLMMVNLQLPEL